MHVERDPEAAAATVLVYVASALPPGVTASELALTAAQEDGVVTIDVPVDVDPMAPATYSLAAEVLGEDIAIAFTLHIAGTPPPPGGITTAIVDDTPSIATPGSVPLQVLVTREPDAPPSDVVVTLVQKPAGVSAAAPIVIGVGDTSGTMTLNKAGGAGAGTYPSSISVEIDGRYEELPFDLTVM